MLQGTMLAQHIDTAGAKAKFDTACKNLLANKMILAWIMKHTMEEYNNYSVQEIAAHYIEGDAIISKSSAYTAPNPIDCTIYGDKTEDASLTEGTVIYDIRFRAIVPQNNEPVTLIINLEAQNNFYPGYPLIKRGIYYCCRLISGQYGTEFEASHYEKIKKVYSVWICINPPKAKQNTITKYEIKENNLVGNMKETVQNYDLLSAVMICLSPPSEESIKEKSIIGLLSTLLSAKIMPEDKKRILKEYYEIPMTKEIKEAMNMCNYGDWIEQKGIEKGILMTLCGLVKDGVLQPSEAAKRMNLSAEEFIQIMNNV